MPEHALFSPIATETDKFVITALFGSFLLGGLPLSWMAFRIGGFAGWVVVGTGIIGFAGSAACTYIAWDFPDVVTTRGFICGLLAGGFSGYGLILADILDTKRIQNTNTTESRAAKETVGLDAKNHNEQVKFIANFYNTISLALIATVLITPLGNLMFSSGNFVLSWATYVFMLLVALLAAGFHLWARRMFKFLIEEPSPKRGR